MSGWIGGLADWTDGDAAYLSVAFTWLLDKAYAKAVWYRALGYRVRAGGPALFLKSMRHEIEDVAECGGEYPDAIARQNPNATIASRGCPVGCWFCIVPPMEGREFTLIPDFPVRPILCDNNLSALPEEYQDHVISRYVAENVPLLDANSGFEPRTFDQDCYARWSRINRGPWRFAYDEQQERPHVERVMRMLRALPARKKRVYVLIGNEPFDSCMERIKEVIAWGGEPHVQPYIKLNALHRVPHVRFDWTAQRLKDVGRWANAFLWKKVAFSAYDRRARKRVSETYDPQQGLFL